MCWRFPWKFTHLKYEPELPGSSQESLHLVTILLWILGHDNLCLSWSVNVMKWSENEVRLDAHFPSSRKKLNGVSSSFVASTFQSSGLFFQEICNRSFSPIPEEFLAKIARFIVSSSTIDKKLEITKNSKIHSKLTKKLENRLEIFEIFQFQVHIRDFL